MQINVRKGTIPEAIEISLQIPEFADPYGPEEYENRLKGKHLILIAEVGKRMAGFKVGYEDEQEPECFYSWFGGVLPGFRQKGIATALLAEMENWCRVEQYKKLRFKTMNMHRNMIIFGIVNDFEIYRVKPQHPSTKNKIYFEKSL